ncbi:MAG: hypothetical protein MH252_21300 [Thermosynechococcaceae cyanobacterium MS004]|nr:hypothetical protein [Thermosynechococcaceae cyanobacterium MS004]
MQSLTDQVRGLWMGAALGELSLQTPMAAPSGKATPLAVKDTVQGTVPKTYGLMLLATRQLKHLIPETEAFGLRCARWQDVLLRTLAIAFLHPAATQGLAAQLSGWCSDPRDRERFVSAFVVVCTLEWLQHQRPLQDLIPDLLRHPELEGTHAAFHLENVQQHLLQRASLQSVVQLQPIPPQEWTPSWAIALCLYAVLSTPQDFQLTVQRARQMLPQQPELVMLTAALSGFYNGLATMPLEGRWTLKTLKWKVAVPFETGLLTLADLCAAQWAGSTGLDMPASAVFHAPGQLRPR